MRQIVLFLVSILLFSIHSIGQNGVLSTDLMNELETTSPTTFLKVNVIMKAQIMTEEVKMEFDAKNLSSSERAQQSAVLLQEIASKTQKQLLQLVAQNANEYTQLRSFWIINMISIEASPALIKLMAQLDVVERIELESSYKMKAVEPIKIAESEAKSVGGIEPGLVAINAPALWRMGYTGRGRLSFTLDTGVWPGHPSLGGRFIGNNFSMKRAWLGFDSNIPRDKGNSHGTHVTGTTLGLDLSTNDTIGVAFNAHFMASDPVATSLATVKPLTAFVSAFEWALNPDGDPLTTDDIPDVINNSWGYDVPTDTLLCHSFVSQILDALELAGIACVFSAGNDGPGDSTIGAPHHINTGLVKSFTVGSISPHDTTYPISNFSSRGPSICPATGALAIKPEVVAPGYQIRSSVDQNSYAVYNGTSMASPHVTGVVLLLKEAFPALTGETILLAIYNTARDLGPVGEDNTYGKGLIDALAAFNYLAQTYTPTPPRSMQDDFKISAINQPQFSFTCDTVVYPEIEIQNLGSSTLQLAEIRYWIDKDFPQYFMWTGNLSTNQSATIILPSINTRGQGDKELQFQLVGPSIIIDGDDYNNFAVTRFNVRGKTSLPYFEDFEYMSLSENGYHVENPDGEITWRNAETGGLIGNTSAQMPCFSYSPRANQTDDLLSPIFDFPSTNKLSLIFNYAYQLKISSFADTLKVYIVDNCDLSQKTLIYAKGGADLETFDSANVNFVPAIASHWSNDTIDLSPYAGMQNIMLDFQSVNRNGNNIYLDNIRVFEGNTAPSSIWESTKANVKIYPNPTSDMVYIESEERGNTPIQITIFDAFGKAIKQMNYTTEPNIRKQISLQNYAPGLYFIQYSSITQTTSFKVVKK